MYVRLVSPWPVRRGVHRGLEDPGRQLVTQQHDPGGRVVVTEPLRELDGLVQGGVRPEDDGVLVVVLGQPVVELGHARDDLGAGGQAGGEGVGPGGVVLDEHWHVGTFREGAGRFT